MRPLLPAPPTKAGQSSPTEPGPSSSPAIRPPRRRAAVPSACGVCRRRKIKCDAGRPSCSRCSKNGLDCIYDTAPDETRTQAAKRRYEDLQIKHEEAEELHSFIQTRSEAEAREMVGMIRAGTDTKSLVKLIRDGDLPLQLSLQSGSQSTWPFSGPLAYETQSRADQLAKYCREKHLASSPLTSETLGRLQMLPEDQALELLHAIRRRSTSPESPAGSRYVQRDASVLPSSLSEQHFLRALLPPTQNGLEFELTVRYPIAYPTLFPIDVASLPLEVILGSNKFRLSGQSPPQTSSETNPGDFESSGQGSIGNPNASQDQIDPRAADQEKQGAPKGSKNISQVSLVDDRLRRIKIDFWTEVSISDSLAGQILSLYLELDYPAMPLFQADLFLDDLIHQRTEFCSSFLVNALLCFGCEIYTGIDPNATAFTVAFYREARRRWADESHHDTLAAVAGLNLLSMATITYGRDDLATKFIEEGAKMGRRLGLFSCGPDFASSAGDWLNGSTGHARRRAASYTAWGVFNWAVKYGLHYHTAWIDAPPTLPKPADIGADEGTPSNKSALLDVKVFHASCGMSLIINDVLWKYNGSIGTGSGSLSQLVFPEFSEETYHRLLNWTATLPLDLARGDKSSHAIFLIHIYYHAIITDIFRPFLDHSRQGVYLKSFTTPKATPQAVYTASVNQLKRLLLIYRIKFKRATLSVLWQTAVIYVANGMMREARSAHSTEWRFYFELCMAGLGDLTSSFRVFETIAHALLGIALRQGVITVREGNETAAKLQELGRHHVAIDDPEAAPRDGVRWIVDLDLSVTDPSAAQGSHLAEHFQRILLKDDVSADELESTS